MASSKQDRLIRGDHLVTQITPADRRQFIRQQSGLLLASAAPRLPALVGALAASSLATAAQPASAATSTQGLAVPRPLQTRPSAYPLMEKKTSWEDITTYNNFYEFGTQKSDPSRRAPSRLRVDPWTLVVDGLVAKPKTFGLEDLMRLAPIEERVYRMRCVEGWSMVIPWSGYSLSALLKQVQPLGSAKFVEFTTLADEQTMPGLSSRVLDWPYREGLRLDEAQHPLSLLTVGLYGQTLTAQNGAPVRLVVPWKYGFKSAKSIVRIRLLEQQPTSSWTAAAPQEYGFYSNVNPAVSHPRWSQATERRIGEDGLFAARRPTLPFNGYADLVEGLYRGMDLRRFY